MLLALWCALPQPQARAQTALRVLVADPHVAAQTGGAERLVEALDATLRAIAAEAGASAQRFDITMLERAASISEGLGAPTTWDLAVLVPGLLIDRAVAAGDVQTIPPAGDGAKTRDFLLADVAVYGFVDLHGGVRMRPWEDFAPDGILSVPNIEAEPAFVDVLAQLRTGLGERGFQALWARMRSVSTSAALRKRALADAERALDQQRPRPAIVRLDDSEVELGTRLWTARLGVCVARGAPPLTPLFARGLCDRTRVATWLGRRPLHQVHAASLRLPATRTEVRDAYTAIFQRGGPVLGEDLPDWLTTALLAGAALATGLVIWRSSRRRGPL